MKKEYYTAGEIAKICNVTVRTIRYYDIKGILKPIDYSEAGYRYYNDEAIEKLQKILMLKYLGYSLEEIQDYFKKENSRNLKSSLGYQKKMLIQKKQHLENIIKAVEIAEKCDDEDLWNKLIEVIQLTTEKEEIIRQYSDDSNLQKRINIHAYSTSSQSWMDWIFDRLKIKEGDSIFEIGSGNALLWESVMELLPRNISITLSDYSEGMINDAKKKLDKYKDYCHNKKIAINYEVIDAEKLQDYMNEDKGKFDVIIANHMLFHVNNREELFMTVKKHLKKEGSFFCSTVGSNHMKELEELVSNFDKRIQILSPDKISFNLQNGKEQLNKVFTEVLLEEQENNLLVDDVDVIYNYVYSYPGNAASILAVRGERLKEDIQKIIDKSGAMYIHKAQGMFCCKY